MTFNLSAFQVVTWLLTALLIAAALIDIVWLQIPNWLPVAIAVTFLTAALLSQRSAWSWWVSHLAAGLIVLLAGIVVFVWGLVGGGDIKLLAAVALWFGLRSLPKFLLATVVAAVAVTAVCLLLRSYGTGAWWKLQPLALQSGKGAPMAVAIAVGCWLTRGRLLT